MSFSLMLAADLAKHNFDLTLLRYPVYVSPKLDGIRAFVDRDGCLMTRNLKPVPNLFTSVRLGRTEFIGLDGELCVGDPAEPGLFTRTQSGVRKRIGEPAVHFYVFDLIRHETPYADRYAKLLKVAASPKFRAAGVRVVPQRRCNSAEEVLEFEAEVLAAGYEGVMLRKPAGLYKYGRCSATDNDLWKLKRFIDGEAVVTGIEEARTNNNAAFKDELGRTKRSSHAANKTGNGMVGAIIVRDPDWGEMRLSPGVMPHKERERHWSNNGVELIGRTVHWRAFGYGVKEKPRFPRYYGLPIDR